MNKFFTCIGALAILTLGLAGPGQANLASGDLFYTTFTPQSGANVWSVHYDHLAPASFTISNNQAIGLTSPGSGADGILFAPNGNLLIGGQSTNHVYEMTVGGVNVANISPGVTGQAFHLALSSTAPNTQAYTMANGGAGANAISGFTLAAGGLSGNGTAYTVSSTTGGSLDVRGLVFDPVNSTWYYGTAPDGGLGDFGTVVFNDVAHTATLTTLISNTAAHGLSFDPFTNDIIYVGASTITQFQPGTGIIGTLNLAGNEFDQASITDNGHLFVASNNGNLIFVDYDDTGNIQTNNFNTSVFLNENLDDIAPLTGPGAQTPEPATLALFGAAMAGFGFLRRKRSNA